MKQKLLVLCPSGNEISLVPFFVILLSFGRSDMYRKRVQICIFLLVFLALLSALAVLFYVYPVKCDWCEYLTCIPITDKFCEKYDLNAHLV